MVVVEKWVGPPGVGGGEGSELLGVGRVVKHLADCLDNAVAIDAVDLEQLLGLAAAGGVGHRQALQSEVGLIDHRRSHSLPETTWKNTYDNEVEEETHLSS